MMYRYDNEGQVVEMKLVDWQITRLGHPVKDMIHFLFNSTSEKLGRYAFGGSVDCQLVKAIAHIALGD